jgi:hypothetical protein
LASATPTLRARFWSTVPTPANRPLVDERSESMEAILPERAYSFMAAVTMSAVA